MSYQRFAKPQKKLKHKYGAQKSVVDGISFGSKLEAAVYSLLKLRQAAGEILGIKMQTALTLKEKCNACGAGAIVFKVDFSAVEVKTGKTFYIEAKGVRVASYVKRERLFRKNPPGRLEVWGGSYRSPRLLEVIGC